MDSYNLTPNQDRLCERRCSNPPIHRVLDAEDVVPGLARPQIKEVGHCFFKTDSQLALVDSRFSDASSLIFVLHKFLECFPSVTRDLARQVLECSEQALLPSAAA